jgi:hypothetical protein
MHCLDRPARGTPAGAIPKARIRRRSWWECNRRQRPRMPSRGTHPTAITPISAEWNALGRHHGERLRTPTWLAGQRVHSAWCRPTSASSRRRSGERDRADCSCYHAVKALPIDWGGAADAPGVGPLPYHHLADKATGCAPLEPGCRLLICHTIKH